MKKSTLITTIAMIVVVVVALSTATYAWFTASPISTATVEMTTLASADLSLTVVNNLNEAKSWTSGATGVGVALSANVGLWSPEAALSNTVAYSLSDLAMSKTNFYEANYKTADSATQKNDSVGRGLDAIRVTNITGADKVTMLYIIVAVDGDKDTTNNLYAAQATSFYISVAKSTGAPVTITNGYGYGNTPTTTYVPAVVTEGTFDDMKADLWYQAETVWTSAAEATYDGEVDYFTKVTGFGAGAVIDKNTTGVAASTPVSAGTVGLVAQANFSGASSTLTSRPQYNGLTTGGFIEAASDNSALGVTAGQFVLAYRIDLGTLASNESVILGVYNWIDGWYADNAAGNASYHVTYAFTTTTPATL